MVQQSFGILKQQCLPACSQGERNSTLQTEQHSQLGFHVLLPLHSIHFEILCFYFHLFPNSFKIILKFFLIYWSFKNTQSMGAGVMAQCMYCSSRRPEFRCQQPCAALSISSSREAGALFQTLQEPTLKYTHTQTHMYIHNFKKGKNKSFFKKEQMIIKKSSCFYSSTDFLFNSIMVGVNDWKLLIF